LAPQKIMELAVDREVYISYCLTMDQIKALVARLHVDLRRQASAVCPREVRAVARPARGISR
jgi:hypothetical protein